MVYLEVFLVLFPAVASQVGGWVGGREMGRVGVCVCIYYIRVHILTL